MLHYAAVLFVATATMASPQATVISPLLLNPPEQLTHLHQDPLPVSVRFENQINRKMLDQLEELGAKIKFMPSGRPATVGNIVSMVVPKMVLPKLMTIPGIARVESAVPTMYDRPLYNTARQVQADQMWWPAQNRSGSMGEGITIADIESAWDIFHPDYFKPDAGYISVRDSNGDGIIAAGDEIDLDGDGEFESKLSVLESGLEEGFQPDLDWLYIDENEDGKRNYGGSTVTDLTPAFGEPIFIGDDINQDGRIADGEKLIRLGTSKVKALYDGTTLYKRGDNLSKYPRDFIQENIDWNFMSHGTGAAGIAVAGWPGLRRHTGIAPAADLVLVGDQDKVAAIAMTQELKADVVFHEWNDWQNFQDGSTNIEQAVSSSAATNQVQVAPAGNLANAAHIMNLSGISENPQVVSLTTDDLDWHEYRMFNITFTWQGSQSDIQIGLRNEENELQRFQGPYSEFSIDDTKFQGWYDLSERGTSMLMVYASLTQGGILPERVWDIEISGSESVERVRGVLLDDRSGWGQGVSWTSHVSDNGSALSPATADTVIAVGAHGGVEDQGPWGRVGHRRAWSGMGPRIDGERVVDISSPDDPMVCASRDNEPDVYGAYGRFGGTSGATPHVAGAAALMLGSGMFDNHEDIERALTAFALADDATGTVPNEAYGYGKIKTAESVFGESITHNDPPIIVLQTERNEACELIVGVKAQDIAIEFIQVDFDLWYNGHLESAAQQSITLPEVETDIPLVVHVQDNTGSTARMLTVINPSQFSCEPVIEENGGCAAQGSENAYIFLILLLCAQFLRRPRWVNP